MKYNHRSLDYQADHQSSNMRVRSFDGLVTIYDYFYGNVIDRIDLTDEEGTNRINVILNWYRKWCWTYNHYQQWLPPDNLKELGELWKFVVETRVDSEVYDALGKGVNRFEQATDKWCPPMMDRLSSKADEYIRIYLHAEEPRFCAIREVSVWKKVEEYLLCCSVAEHARFLQSLINVGVRRTIFSFLLNPFPFDKEEWFRKEKGLKIKTGKILSLFYDNSDNKLSEISEVLAGYVTDVLRERIASVDDVEVCDTPSEIYSLPHHAGIGSCMKELNSERFELYDVLECCSVAYIVDGDDVVQARALLWNDVVGFNKTTKIMDTIYAKDSDTVAVMKKWAVENGYWYKTSQAHACREFTNGKEKGNIPNDARVYFPEGWSIYRGIFIECPYVDTFKTYDYGRNFLKVGGGRYDLSSTGGDGDIMTENIMCCKCYENLHEEEPWQDGDDNYYCESCRDENFEKCDCCGNWFKIDNIRYVEDTDETFCEDCYDERYFWCSYCETDHPIDEMIKIKVIENGEFKGFVNCCQDEADEYYPDRKECPMCGYFESEGNLVEIDGQEMCSDCVACRTLECASCGDRHLRGNIIDVYVSDGDNTLNRTHICKECHDNQTGSVYKCDQCTSRTDFEVWHWKTVEPPVNFGYEQICPKCYRNRLNEEEKAA